MQLVPIGRDDIAAAVAVLRRGLADPPTASWADTLERLFSVNGTELAGPIGYLLRDDAADVGILLTLRSRRAEAAGGSREIVNLSSWYIDEPYRWFAPMMLKKVLRGEEAAFTDLTASAAVRQMLPALKFKTWTDGVLLTSLPQSLARFRRDVSIIGHDKLRDGQLHDDDMKMLCDHARMGCIAAVMKIGDQHHPLIFAVRRRRGVPHAYLIYAPDRQKVLSALGNICAHLLRRGQFLMALDCNADECAKAGSAVRSFRPTVWHKYFSGPIDTGGIDYAYSEFVYMGGT